MSAIPAGEAVARVASDIRQAARALARHGLVHAYGHVSARTGAGRFVVTPARPLGLVVDEDPLVECTVEGPLPGGALPEVRLHQAIYRARGDVGGVCRFQSPRLMSLSAARRTPRARHGLGAYFAPAAALFDDPGLVRDDPRAALAAERLGGGRALVLRGNGAITVGTSVREAACHAFFLEDAARVELDLLGAGLAGREGDEGDRSLFTADEAAARATSAGGLYERMWQWLTDPRSTGGPEARS